MRYDARGVPVSAGRSESLQQYETALQQFQSYVGDPIATLDAALAEDPEFVTGHLMKGLVLYTLGERKYGATVEACLAAAAERTERANERERMLMQALRQLPADLVIPAQVAVDAASLERVRKLIRTPRKPTSALRSLMRKKR